MLKGSAEIWAGFADNEVTGQVGARRHYIKLLAIECDTVVGLVADADKGYWSGLKLFRGRPSGLNRLRSRSLVYRK